MGVLSQLLDIYSAFKLLLGTWPSACYQRVDVLSQLLDSPLHVGLSCCYFAFELLLGTWPSACYQRADVLSQLSDIYYAFQLLLGTWPSACYRRVDVLSQLFDCPLHVGLSCCYSASELLLGTWPSACYQCVGVLSQLVDIYYAFQLLLGTWPSACYQRVDVLSQLLNSPLHVANDTLGPALLVLMARCKTRKTLHRQEVVPASTAVLPHTFESRLLGQRFCGSMRV